MQVNKVGALAQHPTCRSPVIQIGVSVQFSPMALASSFLLMQTVGGTNDGEIIGFLPSMWENGIVFLISSFDPSPVLTSASICAVKEPMKLNLYISLSPSQ